MSAENNKTPAQRRGIRLTILVIVVFVTVVMLLFLNKLNTPRQLSRAELMVNGAVEFEQPRIFSTFNLVDHTGKDFTPDNLKGHWTLAFFGFASCPDICPTTMIDLKRWYTLLDEEIREKTQVLMISVDPERDTPEVLNQYVPYFHQDFIGVTGEPHELLSLSTQLNIAYAKVPQGDDYTMDHSSNLVLINPKGHYHGFFKPTSDEGKLKLTFQSIVTSSAL